MSVTLKEIAYHAGVHVSVVSRVLNDKADKYRISQKCQEKVKKVAFDLGYIPNAYAVGIKTGAFQCVALLDSGLEGKGYLPEKLIYEIHRNLESEDEHLLLANIPQKKLETQELPKIFRSLMADGLIVNDYHYLPQEVKDAIAHTIMPTIWINYKMPFNAVYPDSYSAAKKATEYLIDLGHKRISYCNVYFDDLKPSAHYSVQDRRNGYAAAMKEASLEIMDITPNHKVDDITEKQVELFYSVLKRKDRPTAMLFYWSFSVPPAFAAASKLNLRIPEDLSIISFAGESHQRIGLSSTAMLEPETDMGREAVAMLRKKMKSKKEDIASVKLNYLFADMKTCTKASEK